jgi:hypothetical protein
VRSEEIPTGYSQAYLQEIIKLQNISYPSKGKELDGRGKPHECSVDVSVEDRCCAIMRKVCPLEGEAVLHS